MMVALTYELSDLVNADVMFANSAKTFLLPATIKAESSLCYSVASVCRPSVVCRRMWRYV